MKPKPCWLRTGIATALNRKSGRAVHVNSQEVIMKASHTLIAAAVGGILVGATACGGETPPAAAPMAAPADSSSAAPMASAAPAAPAATDMAAAPAKHACKGMNACKGQGGCKTDKHGCKGQNDCKGQGGCKSA